MRIPIERHSTTVHPDSKRVIARFFFNGDDRAKQVVERIMTLNDEEVFGLISPILQEYSKRHRNITRILEKNFDKVKEIVKQFVPSLDGINKMRKLLIGAYFTHEYSIESAAFFNPSIVEDPDQTELVDGEKRLIISFRAVGEGHISSIVFRRAMIDKDNNIRVMPAGNYVDEAEIIHNDRYDRKLFFEKAVASRFDDALCKEIEDQIERTFDQTSLKKVIEELREVQTDEGKKGDYEKILWLSDSYYDISFSLDTDISDRVIFPISPLERKGIEDARFVKFTEEDGSTIYYATYTAFDGTLIMPKLLQTKDFYQFKIRPMHGAGAQNKNLAIFPRRIQGNFAMLSRIDGSNNYIMYSKDIDVWEKPIRLQEPLHYWEFIQIGNCGSPIETDQGWLVITHGVGAMRRYSLGATLLKLDDPTVELGRLKEPLLVPNQSEREGYVPNVVYSCGSIVNNGKLVIPYGLSDYSTSFATVNLKDLLSRILLDSKDV